MSNHLLTIIFIVFIFAHLLKIVQVGGAEDEELNIYSTSQTEANEGTVEDEKLKIQNISPTEPGSSNTSAGPSNTTKYPPLMHENQLYCPAENLDREILEKLQRIHRNILFTLFKTIFRTNDEKLCKYECEPLLYRSQDMNGNQLTCGSNPNMHLYSFAFQFWKDQLSPLGYIDSLMRANREMNLIPKLKISHASIYAICYDNSISKVAFTRHKINSFPIYQSPNSTDELSTKPYSFENDHFYETDRAFQAYNDNPNNTYKMIKQKLVPVMDILPWQQKAVKHFINVAPLWEKLSLLMKLINFGIQRADFQIKRKFHHANTILMKTNPQAVHELIIYTKVIYWRLSSQEQQQNAHELRIPYAWVKFVHYRAAKLGVLIYIHNTPPNPPQEGNIYCNVQNRFDCNFTKWLGLPEPNRNFDNLQYAYCCKASPLIISLYFSTPVDIVGDLHIDKVANGDINVSTIPPIPIRILPNISQVAQQRNIGSSSTSAARHNILIPNTSIRINPNSSNSHSAQQTNIGSSATSAVRKPIPIPYSLMRINLNSDNSQVSQPRGIANSNIYSATSKNISNPQSPITLKFKSGESSSTQQMTNKSGDTSTSAKTTEAVDTSDTSMQFQEGIDTSDLPFQEPEPEPQDPWTKKRYTSKRPRFIDSNKSSN